VNESELGQIPDHFRSCQQVINSFWLAFGLNVRMTTGSTGSNLIMPLVSLRKQNRIGIASCA
jgi:hypothetical protein